jgi:SAM-dependent methyltransferase
MPEQIDPRGQDNPSQYVVEDRSSNPEMIRLMIQDNLYTTVMGGPLSEQADPASLHHVLDIGCGPGGWILEAARLYPHMNLTGTDISWRMIEYARAQAQARKFTDGVEFLVMDALRPSSSLMPHLTWSICASPSVFCSCRTGSSSCVNCSV